MWAGRPGRGCGAGAGTDFGCAGGGLGLDARGGDGHWREFAGAPGGEQIFERGEKAPEGEPEQDHFERSTPGVPRSGGKGLELASRDEGQGHYSHECVSI